MIFTGINHINQQVASRQVYLTESNTLDGTVSMNTTDTGWKAMLDLSGGWGVRPCRTHDPNRRPKNQLEGSHVNPHRLQSPPKNFWNSTYVVWCFLMQSGRGSSYLQAAGPGPGTFVTLQ